MLLIRDHGVADYTGLLDMDATDIGVLSEDDLACLDELGAYLAGTQAWQRFAVWLLHKHFEPADGEIFVERATPDRELETTLVPRSMVSPQQVSASGIRFDADVDSDVSVIALEFAEPADFGPTPPLSADDETVLAGIAQRLRAHDKIDRFGVKLIRNPLALSEDELLLETCDSAIRTLYCDISSRDAIPADLDIIETTWRWNVVQGEGQPVVMQTCAAACVPAVAEGHDLKHGHSGTDNDDNPIGPVYP
jgi:hypothetical protein